MTDAEAFYVAARLLEEVAKSEGDTEAAAVCARVAERVADGEEAEVAVGAVAADVGCDAERAVGRLRVALSEVREDGYAQITENVDDAVAARLRSEFD